MPQDAAVGASVGNKIMVAGNEDYLAHTFTDVVNVFTSTTTGIPESSSGSLLRVWPNPAKDKITINLPHDRTGGKIFIYSVNGQVQLEYKLSSNNIKIDISQFPQGIYFIKYINESSVVVTKIIKN